MDVDMKNKEDLPEDKLNGRERDRERDRRDRSREKREKDRDRSRDPSRDRERRDLGRRRNDHWEPERRTRRRSRSPRSRSRSPRRRSVSSRRRSRHYYSRSRSPRYSRSRSRSRSRDRKYDQFARSLGGPMNADPEEALEFSKISKRENRVYVGNLSYDVRYRDLMEFMRGAGEVLFAEVLVTPTGISKGCGIVEFASQEDAQRAIRELSEVPLLGRPVFIREDRENEARFGATPVPGKIGMAMAGQGLHAQPPPRSSSYGGGGGGGGGGGANPGNQLYIGNLPYQAGWQDLKDLFRQAGNIVRADINIGADGRAKGSGTVLFETVKDAQSAISMYNGYEWYGRVLEVREDRYAGLSGPGTFRGSLRGRGGFRGGRGGGLRGGFRSGFGGGSGDSRSIDDLYKPYTGPDSGADTFGSPSGFGSGYGNFDVEPNQQIMVRNLPWSTANEDLVELFETTGTVELAEILYDGSRSKGAGVVQFAQVPEAETAIAKFQNYMYGGRPLDVRYNDRWHTFTPHAARGGTVAPIQADATM